MGSLMQCVPVCEKHAKFAEAIPLPSCPQCYYMELTLKIARLEDAIENLKKKGTRRAR